MERSAEQRAAWLAARRLGIGSSDAAAICNQSKWGTPLHVYLDKIGELPDQDDKYKRRGRRYEELVAQDYAEETGHAVIPPPSEILVSGKYPWMLASLDRLALVDSKRRILECKTAAIKDGEWGEPGSDQVPDHYNIQVQHQMAVAELDEADIAVRFNNEEFSIYTVARNDEMIVTLARITNDFWARVQRGVPPPPDWQHSQTLKLLRRAYGVSDQTIELDEEILQIVKRLLVTRQQMSDLQAIEDDAKARLLYAMGEATQGNLPSGYTLQRKRVHRKGYKVEASSYVTLKVKEPR